MERPEDPSSEAEPKQDEQADEASVEDFEQDPSRNPEDEDLKDLKGG